jgi:hypothetical protein
MIISFTNVIGAIRSLGEAAQVITTNLKMWLGFETSETLGREEVVNGDFATDSDWSEGAGWDIDLVNNKATCDGTQTTNSNLSQVVYTPGKVYKTIITVDLVDAGSLGIFTGTPNSQLTITEADTYTIITEASTSDTIYIQANEFFDGSISNISVKELTQITPDKSGNNNVGELFTGKALDFDANGDYVDISGFSMSGNNATFAFWAYIRDNARADYFFDFYSTSTRFLFGFGQASRKLAIYSNSGSGDWQDFGDPPQDQWVRIVLTVNGTTAKCFVDGVQLGTDKTISTYDFSTPTTAHIGARYTPETTPKWYDGLLSDFQVYNKAWLNEDIAYDYANPNKLAIDNPNASVSVTNLKAYWAMSEGAGSLTYDSSGEGNNGTINGATYEPAQPRIPQLGMMNWAKSTPVADEITLIPNPNNTSEDILRNAVRDRLNSFNLDGSGYSSVANSSTLQFGTSAFTIQAWIKPFSLASNNRILTKGVTGNGEFMISVGGDGASARVFAKDSNGISLDTSNDFSSLTINSWQMITVIIDTPNDQILFFKNDGNVETKIGASWTGNFNSTQPITIGNTSSVSAGQFFDGLVSDALVYDRALTSDEIENNYNAGLSAHTNN